MTPSSATLIRRPTLGGVLAAIGGLILFAYFLRRAGITDVADGIRRVGWVFLIVVALQGFRFLTRAAAWLMCLDRPHRLNLWQAFQAVMVGDALGNLTPLSLLVSEPAKAMFLLHQEPLKRTLSALTIENLFYTLSAALMITSGLVALFLRLRPPEGLWLVITMLFLAVAVLIFVFHWIIWRRVPVASGTVAWLGRRGVAPNLFGGVVERVRTLEEHIYVRYPRDWSRLLSITALELSFHGLAILEIFLVLSLISGQWATILDAFLFESTNRFIQVVFKFVPLRIGVDEAGTGMFADLLAFGTLAGVTLAIVRKARMLVWMALGVAVLVQRGLLFEEVRAISSPTNNVALVVMARSPAGGQPPKTRLVGAVTTEDACRRLYAAFLEDTIRACQGIKGTVLRVAYTPDGGAEGLLALGLKEKELMPQRGNNLGARERNVFRDLFTAGFSKVVMIGSDLPTLPARHITEAVMRLDRNTVVLGPSEDGGYYLIGLALAGPEILIPEVFNNISWSSSSAFKDTAAAVDRAGLTLELVPTWYDVDSNEDLARLRTDLADPEHAVRAPRTTKVLREIFSGETEDKR